MQTRFLLSIMFHRREIVCCLSFCHGQTLAVYDYIWLIRVFHVKQFCLRCCIIGRLFVACPRSSDSFTTVPLSRTMSATVGTAGQTVRFNLDNGNKTSPYFVHIRLAYPLPKF